MQISVFIDCENDQLLKKRILIIQLNLAQEVSAVCGIVKVEVKVVSQAVRLIILAYIIKI